MRRESKTQKRKLPDYILEILNLQFMDTEYYKQYGCNIYRTVLEKGRIYRQVNDNWNWNRNLGVPVDKVKSVEHFIKLQEGEGFSVLDEVIDFRYYNK